MKKITALLFLSILVALSSRAGVLFQDSTNYPYNNGCIEGQGQWYCFSPKTPYQDAFVTNNVLYLVSTNHDYVAAPTNGFPSNPGTMTWASFTINVSALPTTNGNYFCQFQDKNDTNDCCHIFAATAGTVLPNTYRLGIANYANSYAALVPPVYFPLDLATGVTYTVVIAFDTNPYSDITGGTLMINPSHQDYENVLENVDFGQSFVYDNDTTTDPGRLDIAISQIAFEPYINAGISNVICGTDFPYVITATNPPVFGIQPQSATVYSGNSTTLYSTASGVDLIYQWYSQSRGYLSDGANFTGSQSNVLIINNLSATDNYYVVATDAYGNQTSSKSANINVITTPTPPFFTEAPLNLTNNLFIPLSIVGTALGTGPLSYQWYFAPANTVNPSNYTIVSFSGNFMPLVGQTNSVLTLSMDDYSYQGSYYVKASSGLGAASGPTNHVTEAAPLVATTLQLHNLLLGTLAQYTNYLTSSYYINTNNVTVGGYVTTYGGGGQTGGNGTYCGFGSTYTEFFIQNGGYGVEVYAGTGTTGWTGPAGNTNTPPVGTYVTITGPLEVYHGGLEMTPLSVSAITTNVAPAPMLAPQLCNSIFNDLATNYTGTNALNLTGSLVTFTNVYFYGSRTGASLASTTGGKNPGSGGMFQTNYYTYFYMTVGGPYSVPNNTNTLEVYQFGYNYPSTGTALQTSGFYAQPIPTHCYQFTGVYEAYGTSPEIEPSRIQDYVVNPPGSFTAGATQTKGVPTISWTAQPGSTYSVHSAANLNGPWANPASGLGYYPQNGTFTDTNKAAVNFYKVSTP